MKKNNNNEVRCKLSTAMEASRKMFGVTLSVRSLELFHITLAQLDVSTRTRTNTSIDSDITDLSAK